MARGKIPIKLIENTTNRQVTYSKRRNGLFKKANELTVLCDAKVSIIMFSSTGKLHEFISASITTKEVFDQYQQTTGVDLWSSRYEKMQQDLKRLKDVNMNLRTQIRQRMGECLNELSLEDLQCLEQDVDESLKAIRERKYRVINNQIDTSRKKFRNAQHIHRQLLHELEARTEDPQYGLVDNEEDYGSFIGFENLGPRLYALQLQSNQPPNLHSGAGSDLTTYTLLE